MDTFEKVAVMKASTPTKGSLLTFLVQLAETEAPDLLQFSADWKAVWAATEVLKHRHTYIYLPIISTYHYAINVRYL